MPEFLRGLNWRVFAVAAVLVGLMGFQYVVLIR
ncbi:hypothetical protein FHS83_000123 [Rhizomicrobium palustre]|uniref:Uncharacterized protein n=1 Tax=Rhizomicrobium palustre TaxID=189966 RepID=A0A846MU95_9PROT|nr:hypothetical protein [Rhizomicrobium palustre]